MGKMSSFFSNLEFGGLHYAVNTAANEASYDRQMKAWNKKYGQRMSEFEKDENRVKPSEDQIKKSAQEIIERAKRNDIPDNLPEPKVAPYEPSKEAEQRAGQTEQKAVTVQESTQQQENPTTTQDIVQQTITEVIGDASIEEIVNDIVKVADMTKIDDKYNFKPFDNDQLVKNINDAKEALASEGCTDEEIRIVVMAMLFASMFLDIETLYRNIDVNNSKKEIEGINALTKAWTGIPVNPAYDAPELEDIADPTHIQKIVEYEKDYQGVSCQINDTICHKTQQAVAAIMEKMSAEETPEEAIVTPIMFVDPQGNVGFAPPRKLGKSDINFYKKKFGGLLDGYKYSFHNVGAVDEIVIENDPNNLRYYTIDHGHLFGIGPCIIVNIDNGTGYYPYYPVSVTKDGDLVGKYLANPKYQPTPEEISRIASRLYGNTLLYANYDLTGIGNVKNTIGEENLFGFYDKLVRICSMPWHQLQVNGQPFPITFPRMRIQYFKGMNNFMLVSDQKVKTPYLDGFNGFTSPMSIKVEEGKLNVSIGTADGITINTVIPFQDPTPTITAPVVVDQPEQKQQTSAVDEQRAKLLAEYNEAMAKHKAAEEALKKAAEALKVAV